MTDILDLPDWTLLAKRHDDDEYELEAEYRLLPGACIKCGSVGRLYKHGTKDTTFRDSPIRGHPVRLLARVQRFRCRDCGETFLQPLGSIQEAMRMTERCAEYVKDQCLRDTFARIAEHVGCDEKTIRTLASEHILDMEANYRPELPRQLGMDETKIEGRQRCVITDIGKKRPIELLADRDKVTVAGWLARFPDRTGVEVVAIDMWRPYLDVAHVLFPGVPVVVDKFHVVRMANEALDRVRIRMGKKQPRLVRRGWMQSKSLLVQRNVNLSEKRRFNLDMWLANEPDVAAAYWCKEAFFNLYDLPKAEAVAAFDAWPETVPQYLRADFRKLLTAARNWRTEILAYFDHPVTNAYTEALNGVAKVINRQGRGYTFEVLRARVLFGKGAATVKPIPELRCESCGGLFPKPTMQVDHIRPLFKGERGGGTIMVCRTCNARFHTKPHGPSSAASTR